MVEIGASLKRLRNEAGLTQEELANSSGVSVSTIRRLESGRLKDHRVATLRLLAAALGVRPEELGQVVPPAGPAHGTGDPAGPVSVSPASRAAAFPAPFKVHGPLGAAAGALEREVRRRWRREEDHRRVHDPFALPVRWRPAGAELVDTWDNIRRLGPGDTRGPLDLAGDLATVTEVYRRVPSGRLVLLGRAGAGKSVLAIRLVLDLIETDFPRVPVLFSLGSWSPDRAGLADWLTDQLLRDHPYLAQQSPTGSGSLAEALVHSDALLPVLDGFDEIAVGLRDAALRELNATSTPLVLTSRVEELTEAVRTAGVPLSWAGGVELADLSPDDVAQYLPRTVRTVTTRTGTTRTDPRPHPLDKPRWEGVLKELQCQDTPAGRLLADVLSTPLMITLARTMYSESTDGDPAELLDSTRFPTSHSVEEHLLAGFVPSLYRSRAPERTPPGRQRGPRTPGPGRAGHWLGVLAHGLTADHDRQDLAWWRIGDSLPQASRLLAVVLTSTVCVSAATWLLGWLSPIRPSEVLLLGLLLGPAAGLAFGCAHTLTRAFGGPRTYPPARATLRLPGARNGSGHPPLRNIAPRLGAVLMGGFVMGVGCAVALNLERCLVYHLPITAPLVMEELFANMLVFGLVFGVAGVLAFGLVAALEVPLDITSAASPTTLLAENRIAVGRQILVLAPLLTITIALVGQVVVDVLQGTVGPLTWGLAAGLEIGAIGGAGGTLAYALAFTAWGQWLVLVRLWLPLTGRLPWDVMTFLDDAHRRGVLRQAGAVYQFRHQRLQHHLARPHRETPPQPAPEATGQP
ncbi:helix-turn-helix domain-containing protein [Kitasatospora sp. NBC_01287]|uniref:helix-turn-helix domain-containing protein n=1 Tax=Kitasatospora sp. NBC_01287 TaxID=2903573 RepID=UPI002257580B|nr:helix-turn-helix domain-containing protein [Kitasatospora sp. NBC_01287]MCX4746074.1 helix-turn-helix domain-containing protein [Kitasatospora sp. NBC_01287]